MKFHGSPIRTILSIIRKEFLQIRRDKRMLPIIFIAPVFQLIVLGYAANLDVKDIPTVICDSDGSSASRELITRFSRSVYFEIAGHVSDSRQIDDYIDNGSASIALVIPKGYQQNLAGNETTEIQLIADGSDANLATTGLSYASAIIGDLTVDLSLKTRSVEGRLLSRSGYVDPEVRVWFNPELKSSNFMVPGILGLLLMLMTMVLTSLAIVKEKEHGTMEQIAVTPIKPYQIVIGKLTPFVVIGIIDILLVMIVATFWFEVPTRGSMLLLFALSIVFLMTTLGLGLFVSTVSRTQQQAMMTAIFFVMQPMIFLSGFVFPIENMPRVIQYYTYLLPLRYYFTIVRGLFLKGVGIAELWDEALILTAFGVAILMLAVARFQKKLG